MPIKNILIDAVGAYLSQVLINSTLPKLSGIEEGRYPKWLRSFVVPKLAVMPEIEERDSVFDSPLKLTTLGFGIGFAGFLWYAAREMDRAALSGADQMEFDLSPKSIQLSAQDEEAAFVSYLDTMEKKVKGKKPKGKKRLYASEYGACIEIYGTGGSCDTADQPDRQRIRQIMSKITGDSDPTMSQTAYDYRWHRDKLNLGKEMSEFWEPEQPELLKAKRTLTLEMEDIAKSDDPIFACMERRGYTQKTMDRLTDSIAKKTTIDMFQKEPEDLTSSENKFQEDIQSCIDTVIKTFGSLEAAGYEDCDCDN